MAKVMKREVEKNKIRKRVKPEKYINPLTDFGFKYIFKDKETMINFLNSILRIEDKIIDLDYGDTERTPYSDEERIARFDLYCKTDTGKHIIIEMQNGSQKYFIDRTIYYITDPIRGQAPKGGDKDWDYMLTPVYSVNILNFRIKDVELLAPELNSLQKPEKRNKKKMKYLTYVQLMDVDTQQVFSNKVTLVYLELPLFKLKEEQLQTDLEKWMYVLKNLPKLTDLPKILDGRVFRRVFNMAEYANLPKEQKDEYDNSLKNYRDMYNSISQRDERIHEQERIIFLRDNTIADLNQEKAEMRQREAEMQKREAVLQQENAETQKKNAELQKMVLKLQQQLWNKDKNN
jgi:predicted transposase/invertase (TIGR01784 family)